MSCNQSFSTRRQATSFGQHSALFTNLHHSNSISRLWLKPDKLKPHFQHRLHFSLEKITLITSELRWLSRKSSRVVVSGAGFIFLPRLVFSLWLRKYFYTHRLLGSHISFVYLKARTTECIHVYLAQQLTAAIFHLLFFWLFSSSSFSRLLQLTVSTSFYFFASPIVMNLFHSRAHHIRTICSSTTCTNSENLLNLPERTRVSLRNELARSIFQLLPISCQTKLRTEELCFVSTEEVLRKLACALLTLRALSTESCRWDEKNFSFLFLPALCARSGPSWERESESLLEKTFPLCTGSDKESAPREAEPCWESLLSGEEKTARARSSPGADLGFEWAEIKLQNVVVVIFLFLEHLRRFYLIMDRMESSM